jgi:hypothetical protein
METCEDLKPVLLFQVGSYIKYLLTPMGVLAPVSELLSEPLNNPSLEKRNHMTNGEKGREKMLILALNVQGQCTYSDRTNIVHTTLVNLT